MHGDLVVIVGPTASGKTDLALRLAEAIGGEVASADSVQVYRHFDVGTGKPSAEERARVPHHLIDIVEPDEAMDAARWVASADAAIAEIRSRGRVPLLCGGTFLWVKALLFGLAEAPPANPELRERHRLWAEREGRAALHARLTEVDPTSAARLNPNDFVRVSRALEVHELSGVTLSEWQAEHAFRTVRHRARLVGIRHDPPALDVRIRTRVEGMLDAGFVEEVRSLIERGFRASRAMGSVGYKQIAEALDSASVDRAGLSEAITRSTRVFARRQRTWLRDQPVLWLEPARAFGAPPEELWTELEAQPVK